jgi:hypothetical protein
VAKSKVTGQVKAKHARAKPVLTIVKGAATTGDSRVVKVDVTVDGGTHVCTIIAMTNQGAALAFTRDDGKTGLFIAPPGILPRGTAGLMKKADPRTGLQQRGWDDPLVPGDFVSCTFSTPSEGVQQGFICAQGPLKHVVVNERMRDTLVSLVSWFKRNGSHLGFVVRSQALVRDPASAMATLPLQQAARLSKEHGATYGTLCPKDIIEVVSGELPRRPFGDKYLSVRGVDNLVSALKGAKNHTEAAVCETLKHTRAVLGMTDEPLSDLGDFVSCTKQVGLSWGDTTRCCCHVKLGADVDKTLQIHVLRQRCQERAKGKRKPGTGAEPSEVPVAKRTHNRSYTPEIFV